jgi:hypothetical protein
MTFDLILYKAQSHRDSGIHVLYVSIGCTMATVLFHKESTVWIIQHFETEVITKGMESEFRKRAYHLV